MTVGEVVSILAERLAMVRSQQDSRRGPRGI
jgi:hypothetical protein